MAELAGRPCAILARLNDTPDLYLETRSPNGDGLLIERAINGIELPDHAEVPGSAVPVGPPTTSSAKP
ncbi:hypothetical protein IU450_35480 [Nocardia abscessus]|uniref:hypothetical protein n=1 Tax=Nocardia abscessus TaxID=120957 RepID=UPI0018962266|nr:hypothetical protein [Nocardia abscessus]MBF6341148.1 hypothetical protein [Nocardia abscessus]